MMAAITAAQQGAEVCLLERNPKVGRKLYITGKGRCNVTNNCSTEEVLAATPRNGRFLYSAMSRMSPEDVQQFFTELGVPLTMERGKRVFPASDRSSDIIDALFMQLRRLKVQIIQATPRRMSGRTPVQHRRPLPPIIRERWIWANIRVWTASAHRTALCMPQHTTAQP